MKNVRRGILFLLVIILFWGCSKNIPISVESNPPGAQIYLDGEFKGVTPRVITYHYDPGIRPFELLEQKKLRLTKEGYQSKEIIISVHDNFLPGKKVITLEKK
jgi:hypothetical protein